MPGELFLVRYRLDVLVMQKFRKEATKAPVIRNQQKVHKLASYQGNLTANQSQAVSSKISGKR